MCSISWLQNSQSLSICFNRDEQRTRPKALAPKLFIENNISALLPIDPEGGGSWISVNDFGVTLCLLNLYEREHSKNHNQISRGQLIKKFAFIQSVGTLIHLLDGQTLESYQPFRLLYISEQDKIEFKWNGKTLSQCPIGQFCTSSSVETLKITQLRCSQFDQHLIKNHEQQLKLHCSHQPQKSAASICMHRTDATTVSFSHLTISKQDIQFSYWDGAPCKKLLPLIKTLEPNNKLK